MLMTLPLWGNYELSIQRNLKFKLSTQNQHLLIIVALLQPPPQINTEL